MPPDHQAPVPVEVRQPDPGALESLRTLISPLVHPLATTGIIIIFVIFILLQREDLRNRLIRLAGSYDLQRTTAALDDAARRLSRLFLTQLIVNGAFGVVIGMGLWLIGIPSAILWGILAAVLRFVPYIGAVIAAAFPLALAVAVDPSWSMLLWTLALFLVVEPVVGHVIEPMVYGHSTGLSAVAVVASATFWTALWGPIGLVLATPSDGVPRRAWASCRAPGISRRHVRRPAGAFSPRNLLPADAGWGSDGSCRKGRRIPERTVAGLIL